MSKYIIHKIPVDISDDKREEYIQYMKNISNNDNNAYFVSLSKYGNYLIIDISETSEPVLPIKTILLGEKEFIKSISHEILQISYDKDSNGMFIKKMMIHPMLNGFSISSPYAYYYFRNNNEESQIRIVEKSIVPLTLYTGHIEKILMPSSRVCESEVAELKKLIQEYEYSIYRYMICNIIQNHCDVEKYEVNI